MPTDHDDDRHDESPNDQVVSQQRDLLVATPVFRDVVFVGYQLDRSGLLLRPDGTPVPRSTEKYPSVSMKAPGSKRVTSIKLHHLVCWTFHGPPPFENAIVRHLDDVQYNCHADNLAWGTFKQNGEDRSRNIADRNRGRRPTSLDDILFRDRKIQFAPRVTKFQSRQQKACLESLCAALVDRGIPARIATVGGGIGVVSVFPSGSHGTNVYSKFDGEVYRARGVNVFNPHYTDKDTWYWIKMYCDKRASIEIDYEFTAHVTEIARCGEWIASLLCALEAGSMDLMDLPFAWSDQHPIIKYGKVSDYSQTKSAMEVWERRAKIEEDKKERQKFR